MDFFYPPKNRRTRQTAEEFWVWFSANSARYHKISVNRNLDAVDELSRQLSRVGPVSWQMSGADGKGIRNFEISADGISDRIPLVRRIVCAAPDLPGWRILAFRQPVPEGLSVQLGPYKLDFDSLRIQAHRRGSQLDLFVFVDGLSMGQKKQAQGAVFLMLDAAIGEYEVMTRIGGVEVRPLAVAPPGHLPLRDLREKLRALNEELGISSPAGA